MLAAYAAVVGLPVSTRLMSAGLVTSPLGGGTDRSPARARPVKSAAPASASTTAVTNAAAI